MADGGWREKRKVTTIANEQTSNKQQQKKTAGGVLLLITRGNFEFRCAVLNRPRQSKFSHSRSLNLNGSLRALYLVLALLAGPIYLRQLWHIRFIAEHIDFPMAVLGHEIFYLLHGFFLKLCG